MILASLVIGVTLDIGLDIFFLVDLIHDTSQLNASVNVVADELAGILRSQSRVVVYAVTIMPWGEGACSTTVVSSGV